MTRNALALPPPPDIPDRPQATQSQPANALAVAPSPSHAETVTTLRHFHEYAKELRGLLLNPDLGRSDMKDALIDLTTRLVAKQVTSPQNAVTQLGTFPERPYEQKKWIEQTYEQILLAEMAVLDHHRAAHPAISPDFATENSRFPVDPNRHIQVMAGMLDNHYRK